MSQLQKITDEQMDAVGVVSAPDVLTGTPSENKNVFDKMVRQLIAPAYNRAVDAIDAINQTESGIQAAEAVRVAAENGRVQAESSRAAAETQRSQAEQARTERESDREAAEQLRSTQETARVQAESSRISAEQERNSAESARASAEAARISAEQGRLSQEELRRQAEQERGSQEEARNAAESARASAESGRGEAERERVSAETARTLAEQERVQAENRREDQETGYIAQAKDGALSAKSWAVGGTGTRAGEDTNNAQFWAQQAAGAAGGGVSSFNGRAGVVLPQSGDYTAEMVGADAAGSAEAVQKNLDAHTSDKDNPHGVTAAQVGADAAGSASAVQASLSAHTGNRSNPHSVTAAQVGADPAGSAEAVRAALTTQMGEMSTAISAASFIKLRALTVSPAVHQVDVDVQDIDLTQYSYLVIIPRLTVAGNSLGRIYMRINGNAEEVYSSISGDQTYLGSFFGTEGFNFYQVNLFEVNRRITMTDLYVNGDAKASLSGSYASRGSLPAESMKVINFSAQYTGDLIEEGGTIHIYGVKR